jgi:hypothetical protein
MHTQPLILRSRGVMIELINLLELMVWIASSPLVARLNIRVGEKNHPETLDCFHFRVLYSEHCSEQRGLDLGNLM